MLEVDVGATYTVAAQPGEGGDDWRRCGIRRACCRRRRPTSCCQAFDDSAITYQARFWIDDYEHDESARDEVRTAIYYAFQRHGIEIPWPIQIEYSREWKEPEPHEQADADRARPARRRRSVRGAAAGAPPRDRALGADCVVYGTRRNDRPPGRGRAVDVRRRRRAAVSVVLEPSRNEVARIQPGGYFGEMSLLTGEPRTATVLAVGDVDVIEIERRSLPAPRRGRSARAIEKIAEWPRSRARPASQRRGPRAGTVAAR